WNISRLFKNYILTDNEERVYAMIQTLDHNLLDYQKELQTRADSSLLVNAVMNPVDTDYYLPDYMEALNIRNIPARFTLVTFDGMVIHSTSEQFTPGEKDPLVSRMIEESLKGKNLSILNDEADVGLTGMIRYNGVVEGYLLMMVNFSTVFRLNLDYLSLQVKEHQYSASYGEILFEEPAEEGENFLTTYHTLETLPINIHVSTPLSLINDPARRFLFQMMGIAFFASFVATAFLSLITGKIMVKPLLLLERGIRNVSTGKWEELRINNSHVREIRYLSTSFNSMQSSLQKRTSQLEQSNRELQQANDNLKKTQTQLIHSEKMASIGQLAAGVAHEINNPTGFIITNLSTMTEYWEVYDRLVDDLNRLMEAWKSDAKEEAEETIKRVKELMEEEDRDFIKEDAALLLRESADGARRIKEIVLGLKNFARPDRSDMKPGNMNDAIEDALKLTWNEIKYKCEVSKNLNPLPDIPCRTDQLTQVIVNLLINGGHAIEEHGKITIESYREGDRIVVKVSDTGVGIPEENLGKLFDPFFTTKEIGKGTGLGLAISHGIIEDHGGEITAENNPDGGCCFTIELPLEQQNGLPREEGR
ncbi:MAG: ATP-binding protein, partial [Spirochaetales bacterium]|nr:ATP-binding protein [Spirochaetales bacterium]